MIRKVYSIRDAKGEIYNLPFFKNTHGEAERDFSAVCRDKNSMPGQFPEDFDLYYLGEFCDQSGTFKALDTPQHIIKAISVTAAN